MSSVCETFGARIVVGVGAMEVSGDPTAHLVTYALGSCLGIAVFDPVACVGGLLHVMLPSSSLGGGDGSPAHAHRYVDTGVPILFRECYKYGATKSRLIVRVAGGSAMSGTDDFQIGKRNIVALRQLLWKNGVLVHRQDVGGLQQSRTMTLELDTGRVWIRAGGDIREL